MIPVQLVQGADFDWERNPDGTIRSMQLTQKGLERLRAAGYGPETRGLNLEATVYRGPDGGESSVVTVTPDRARNGGMT